VIREKHVIAVLDVLGSPECNDDLILYGNAVVHLTTEGTARRVDPRECFPELNAMLVPAARLKRKRPRQGAEPAEADTRDLGGGEVPNAQSRTQ
jgi:hypothetical protein